MHIQVSTHCMHPHSAVPRSYQSGTPLMKSPAKMFDVDASDATPLRVPRCVSRLWNEDYQAAKTHQTWGRSNSFVNYVTNQEWGLWPKVAKCWIYIYTYIQYIYTYGSLWISFFCHAQMVWSLEKHHILGYFGSRLTGTRGCKSCWCGPFIVSLLVRHDDFSSKALNYQRDAIIRWFYVQT